MSESRAVLAHVSWQLGQAVVVELQTEQIVQTIESLQPQPRQIVVA